MRKYTLIILILITTTALIYPRTYVINQDGTGDFTTITEGIDAAVNGDTLLVYPGTYYENIDYGDGDKNIVITSLYGVESDDRRYIRETIIDGNRQGTVVKFRSGEITRDAVLSGFTIQNGKNWKRASSVGGILVSRCASPIIRYCIVENNFAYISTGGILSNGASPLLKGNTVRYNHGASTGGISILGVPHNLPSEAEFCTEELNSVYLNYGGRVNDVHFAHTNQESVIIDTLTVEETDPYFVRISSRNYMPPNFNLTINYGKIESVAANLYVAPDGCDTNSGLSPDEPLQRISTAMTRIQPDSEQQRTVHLAEGIYSHSLNNQLFPVAMRDNIDIIGAGKNRTILHGDDKYFLLRALIFDHFPPGEIKNFSVKNVTLSNAHRGEEELIFGAITFRGANDFILENIIVTNTTSIDDADIHELISFSRCGSFTLRNFHVLNNDINARGDRLFTVPYTLDGETMYAENIRFHNNHSSGNGRIMLKNMAPADPAHYNATFVNLELTDTINIAEGYWGYGAQIRYNGAIRLINATISENIYHNVTNSAAIGINDYNPRNRLSIYNSIFYDNGPGGYQIVFGRSPTYAGGGPDEVNVSHSLIENGIDGITEIYDVGSIVNWGEGNIDADPLWVGEDENEDYPYMLSAESPARGAGTLDIPDFEFPEYDLAGNPRIVDGQIDMGAYQWQPIDGGRERVRRRETAEERHEEYSLRNFPNPAVSLGRVDATRSGVSSGERTSTGTTINFEAPEAGNVVIEIYNLKGQFVSRVFDADVSPGEYNVYWDGRDERNRPVATGFYMYHLKFNDQLVATGRCTFIK